MCPKTLSTAADTHPEVIVLGAGLAGISTALLLRQRHPAARILVIEERQALPESGLSVPLSGVGSVFFSLVLHAADLLAREHLPRHGEHFWFSPSPRATLAELSEVAADEFATCPAHHVDTARLAHGLARRAEAEGIEFCFGALATELHVDWPASRLVVETAEGARELRARWLVDAGGAQALLAHELGLLSPLGAPAAHRASANWSGLTSVDGPEHGPRPAPFSRSRDLATQHFVGPRWRVRVSPHAGGGASVEMFVEQALWREVAGDRGAIESYSRFVRDCPGVRDLLRSATVDPESFRAERHEDRTVSKRCDRGWFLVGGAALTPLSLFGSPLDALARTVWNACDVIADDLSGAASEAEVVERMRRHNLRERQHDTADAEALCTTSLELAGDAALLTVAYALRRSVQAQEIARVAADPRQLAVVSWHTLWQRSLRGGVYARLRRLARARWESDSYGCKNGGWQVRLGPGEGTLRPLCAAVAQWVGVEYAGLREALRPADADPHVGDAPEIERRTQALMTSLAAARASAPATAPVSQGSPREAPGPSPAAPRGEDPGHAGEERDPFASIE